ncbi:AAA family ATPase [Lonepinella koalarum]|uniref:AAA family ATPase n=1 Tax=Lonepinella koalarum TaxID=53417 RepID=UPI003F6DA532
MKQTFSTLRFEQVKGVGTIEAHFEPDQRVYTLIGENGVGKTKFLECLFTLLFVSSDRLLKNISIDIKGFPFKKLIVDNVKTDFSQYTDWYYPKHQKLSTEIESNKPFVYISAQHRSDVKKENYHNDKLGNYEQRFSDYLNYLANSFSSENRFKNLNSDIDLNDWIVQRAKSASPYLTKEDNREIEITTLISLLNKIDERIDPEFLEISGDNRVFLKIENQKRELSELSSGFTSILKILQAIISGYSYFTNETQIVNVPGIVLIDEIESHLHNQWQVKIIPLLKQLFPNTVFFITTHSSLVISQLEDGEAYRLERNKQDGVVYANKIHRPSKVTFIDLMQDAFDVDLNQLKIERTEKSDQSEIKKALLALVEKELEKMGDK